MENVGLKEKIFLQRIFSIFLSKDISILKEKVTEMAVVMHRAVQADEEIERCDVEMLTKLKSENKVLRELLNISGHPKKEIEKLRLKELIEREQSFMNGGVVAAGSSTDHSIESSADEQEHQTGTVKRRFKGQGSEVVSNGQTVNSKNQSKGAFADYSGKKAKSVKENAALVDSKGDDDEISFEQAIGDAESLKDIVDSIDRAKDEGVHRPIVVEENVTSLEVSDSETVNSDGLDDTVSLGSSGSVVDEPNYSMRETKSIEREILEGGSEREDLPAMGTDDLQDGAAVSGNISKDKCELVSSTPRSGSFNEDKDIDIVDAVTSRSEGRKDQEQFLELYNSEGIILDDSDEPLASGSGGKNKARKISAHDSKISGLKIRRSTKQKKVIQADLKSFFAKENEDTKEEVDRMDDKVDEESKTDDLEREEEVTERNSAGEMKKDSDEMVDADDIDADKAENLDKDSSLDDGYGSPNSPRLEETKDGINEDKSPTASSTNVLKATLGSKEGLAIEPPLSRKDVLATKIRPANTSSTYESIVGGKQAREDCTSNVVSNVSLADIFTPPESPIESPDMTDPHHKTIQLDYSDSDSDDPEMMIEDQFADIIGGDSGSDSSSVSSGSDLEIDRTEPTEEEIVGDLKKNEDEEYIISRWVRSDVENSSEGLEAEGRADENTGSSSALSKAIKGTMSDVAGAEAIGIKSRINDNKKLAKKERPASQNDEDFVFNEAYLQMDQFDGGSIEAKYAKRKKNHQMANRASAVTLFAGQAAAPVSGTRSNLRSDSELQSKEETNENGSAADVSTLEAVRSPHESSNARNASSSAPSNAKSEAITDGPLANASSDISLSESSSEEIDPSIFKRKLAGMAETREKNSKCGADLSDLLGDLDAALELEDSDE